MLLDSGLDCRCVFETAVKNLFQAGTWFLCDWWNKCTTHGEAKRIHHFSVVLLARTLKKIFPSTLRNEIVQNWFLGIQVPSACLHCSAIHSPSSPYHSQQRPKNSEEASAWPFVVMSMILDASLSNCCHNLCWFAAGHLIGCCWTTLPEIGVWDTWRFWALWVVSRPMLGLCLGSVPSL